MASAIYIGPRRTTSYRDNRYAGEASLYGGRDVKFILAKRRNMVPADVGVEVFAEAGRVFVEHRVTIWHASYGGDVFYARFERTSVYGLRIGRTDNRDVFVVFEARMAGFEF